MKRTEMVQAVESLIAGYRNTNATNEELADMVITEVELRGMLPPCVLVGPRSQELLVYIWEADNE